jgi:diguanylate cyclase (GGDEF)-like protein
MFSPVNALLVTILSSVMSMAVLGSLLPAAIPGVRYWIGANALASVSLILFALQGHAPLVLSVIFANESLAVVVLLVLRGCRQFVGGRASMRSDYLACLALLCAITYWTYGSPNFNARIVAVSVFHAGAYAAIGRTVGAARQTERSKYSHRFVRVTAFLGCVGHASRGLFYSFPMVGQTTLLQSTPINIAFLSLGILLLPCLSIGMVMLAHARMAERLERLADIDALTGALTRRAFIERAERALKAARLSSKPLSIAVIDIDHFKSINDRYGHAGGDLVLTHFGSLVLENIQPDDLFGRLGGEEFAILCPHATRDDVVLLMNELRGASNGRRCLLPSGELTYTFSAGVDEYCDAEPLADFLARTDAALYSAKNSGRNRVVSA